MQLSKLGPDHPRTLTTRDGLALTYQSLGRWTDAERSIARCCARRRMTVEPSSPLLAGDLGGLGRNLVYQARWTEAESVLVP